MMGIAESGERVGNPVVFISHASEDQTIAGMVCQALENRQLTCWISPRDINPGENFPAAIQRGIMSSQVVVLVFSSHASASSYVGREIMLAVEHSRVII